MNDRVLRFPRWLLFPLLLAMVVLFGGAGCGGDDAEPGAGATTRASTQAAPSPAKLKIALDWFPNPDHVSLYYALDKGYFADRGLTVEPRTPSDPSAGLKLVATSKFDLAVYYEGDMFFAAEQGLPVTAVGVLVPNPLNSMIALHDSKVQGPDSIKGATIGVAGLPFDDAILKTMRQREGLAPADVKKVNVGFNLVPALLTKKADAVIGAYWNIEGTQVKLETGKDPVIIRLKEIGVPHYDELVIVANKNRLASDPDYADAIERFLAAMVKGTEGARADEAGSIDVIEKNTEYKSAEIELMVPATLEALAPPEGQSVGCLDVGAWDDFGRWMRTNRLLEKAIDADTIATNDYLAGC
jgi:putative hydroxymethylpyrimidine transport system substrate-binding protein